MARKKNDPFARMNVEDVKPGNQRVTYGDNELETAEPAVQQTETSHQTMETAEASKPKRGRGRPKKPTTQPNGLQPGEERLTVVVETALADELRDYAYTERITLREALDKAVRSFLAAERERGVNILHRPK